MLRAKVKGRVQVSMGMNGIHDFLNYMTKGVLKIDLGCTKVQKS